MHDYVIEEQPNTEYDLDEKIKLYGWTKPEDLNHDIVVDFQADKLNKENFQIIANISNIISDSGEVGVMEFDIFRFHIKSLNTYEKDLIFIK
tara:strand:+ start:80 stop:355 length:276 start_codon:yes stop_codon:yes gene_type:complete